jgi:hypothetical protein
MVELMMADGGRWRDTESKLKCEAKNYEEPKNSARTSQTASSTVRSFEICYLMASGISTQNEDDRLKPVAIPPS